MGPLTFTVTAISPQEGYTTLTVQLGTSDPQAVTCGDVFNLQCTNEIAALNAVDSPLVLSV